MATVNKDFKIKSGLIVEGTTATVNGFDVLTKKQADQDYVVGLIGGTATSANEANKVVKRDANGNFAATQVTADLVGDVTGQVSDISNHSTTNLTEGTNLYFTERRAQDALAGTISGQAEVAATNLATHEADTTAHGATGAVVGTTNTQTLTNKTIGDTLNFTGAGAMTINSDSHIVLTPAAGSSVKWGADVLATQAYADLAQSDAEATAAADATSKAGAAVTSANGYTNTAISTEVTNRTNAIATAKSEAISAAEDYTDTAVGNLVGSAPELLNTLQELAAALDNDPETINTLQSIAAGKQDTLTAGAGLVFNSSTTLDIDLDADSGLLLNENGTLSVDKERMATQTYVNLGLAATIDDTLIYAAPLIATAKGEAIDAAATDATDKVAAEAALRATAVTNAISTASTDATNKSDAARVAAIAHADALTTSDVAEGTEQYFTTSRAKIAAANLITTATKTNITITGDENGLVISAENGVADSTTSDLAEGTRLYFTDARAVSALEAVTPDFAEVELNSVAKQVAATLEAATAGVQTAHAFAKADYRSAEYLVKVAYGTHTEISKVLLTLDTSDNIAITEYAIVGTNGSASSISAGVSGANVQLLVTTANNNSTVTVMGTLLK